MSSSFENIYRRLGRKAREKKAVEAEAQDIRNVLRMEYADVNPHVPKRMIGSHHSKSVLGQRVKHASTAERTNADLTKRGRE